jgi:hypothetical protein
MDVDQELVAKFSTPAAELRQSVSWMSGPSQWSCSLLPPGTHSLYDAVASARGDTPGDAVRAAVESYRAAQQSLGIGGVTGEDVAAWLWESLDAEDDSSVGFGWDEFLPYGFAAACIALAVTVALLLACAG